MHVVVDGSRLRKILEHLLENAVKYAPAGQPRSGSTGSSSRASRGWASTDEGPGIPAEWRERIFEPYARLRDADGARIRDRAVRCEAAGRDDGQPPVERAGACPGGARFVLAMPAAVAV